MRRRILAICCLIVGIVSIVGALWYVSAHSDQIVPPVAVPSSVPQVTVPIEEGEAEQSVVPSDLPDDPRGDPTQLVIYRGSDVLVSMEFGPMSTTPRGWSSQCGKVAWKDDADWPRPGFASTSRSLITGHVWCQREVYSLDRLRDVRVGDRIEVHYSSGDVVVGIAEQDAASIPKSQLNAEAEGQRNPALHNEGEARTIRVTTCDSESEYRSDGHLSKNVYTLYRVTEIRYAQ